MRVDYKIVSIILGILLLFGFNNCSQNLQFSGGVGESPVNSSTASPQEIFNREPLSESGNGRPYGGKVSTTYYDPQPADCDTSLRHSIQVDEDSLTNVIVGGQYNDACTGNITTLAATDFVTGEESLLYQGKLFVSENASVFNPAFSVRWVCQNLTSGSGPTLLVTVVDNSVTRESLIEAYMYDAIPGSGIPAAADREVYTASESSDTVSHYYVTVSAGTTYNLEVNAPTGFPAGGTFSGTYLSPLVMNYRPAGGSEALSCDNP